MEQHLGQKITYDEVVHHINGDKQDFRIENLEVMPRSEHGRLHRRQQLCSPLSDETRRRMSEALTGVQHHSIRKLSQTDVKEVFCLKQKGISNRKIAAIFGVAHSTINRMLSGQQYKDWTPQAET